MWGSAASLKIEKHPSIESRAFIRRGRLLGGGFTVCGDDCNFGRVCHTKIRKDESKGLPVGFIARQLSWILSWKDLHVSSFDKKSISCFPNWIAHFQTQFWCVFSIDATLSILMVHCKCKGKQFFFICGVSTDFYGTDCADITTFDQPATYISRITKFSTIPAIPAMLRQFRQNVYLPKMPE